MVVNVLFQGNFQVELARAQGEALRHEGRGLAGSTLAGGILDLPDSEGDTVALVQLLTSGVSHEDTQLVEDTQGLSRGIVLQNYRGWGQLRQSNQEGVSVAAQLLDKAVLNI